LINEIGYIYWNNTDPKIQFCDEIEFNDSNTELENKIINLFPNNILFGNRRLTGNNTIPVINIDVPPSKFA